MQIGLLICLVVFYLILLIIVVVHLLQLSAGENDSSVVMRLVLGLPDDERKLDGCRHAQESSVLCLFPSLNLRLGVVRVFVTFLLLCFFLACDLSDGQFEGEGDLVALKKHLVGERLLVIRSRLVKAVDLSTLLSLVEVFNHLKWDA